MTSDFRQVIWTSSLDLSPEGVSTFCRDHAARYGKTEAEMKSMPLMELAIRYMRTEQSRNLRALKDQLNVYTTLPILIILDKADFLNKSHMECQLLSGEKFSDILSCAKDGLSVTFYTDGSDIRCESRTSFGADHYLFREVTDLHNFSGLIQRIERGEAFTESELSANTRSLLPQLSALLNQGAFDHPALDTQIKAAQAQPVSSKPQPALHHEINDR